jgi:hypothetical protein
MLSIPVIELIFPSCAGRRSASVFIFENDNDFQFHRQAVTTNSSMTVPVKDKESEEAPYRSEKNMLR